MESLNERIEKLSNLIEKFNGIKIELKNLVVIELIYISSDYFN